MRREASGPWERAIRLCTPAIGESMKYIWTSVLVWLCGAVLPLEASAEICEPSSCLLRCTQTYQTRAEQNACGTRCQQEAWQCASRKFEQDAERRKREREEERRAEQERERIAQEAEYGRQVRAQQAENERQRKAELREASERQAALDRQAASGRALSRSTSMSSEIGLAIIYGPEFDGLPTANGEIYDQRRMTAAHPSLPLPSIVFLENPATGRQVTVRINDRGPFEDGASLQVSPQVAAELGFVAARKAELIISQPGPGAFYVMVRSFTDPEDADWLRSRLSGGSLPAEVIAEIWPARISGTDHFQVMAGPTATREDAEQIRALLETGGWGAGEVVTAD